MRSGAGNGLTDVDGVRVGHAGLGGVGALSGTTVILAPPGGAVAGVDVRGAAPGTRETDLLDPQNAAERVHAIVLTGGSAFGLDAVSGVVARLEAAGVGFAVPGGVVPIVPAAVLFDLGRGGDFGRRPTAATGEAAYDDAMSACAGPASGAAAREDVRSQGPARDDAASGSAVGDDAGSGGAVRDAAGSGGAACEDGAPGPVVQGCVGAGIGAAAGGLKGGVGCASAVLDDGSTVAALVVVNSAGSPADPETGVLLGVRKGLPGEFPDLAVAPERLPRPFSAFAGTATSLAVVATDVTLDKAGCRRLATMGHDGLARAIDPVHTIVDGDVVFALATGARPAPALPGLLALHTAAADVVTRAVVHALLAADSVTTPAGSWPSYRSLVAAGA